MLGTTNLKKINAYPELRTTKSINEVIAFVKSFHNKKAEMIFPKGLNHRQEQRYYDKFSENFGVIKDNLYYSTVWDTKDDNGDTYQQLNRLLLVTKPEDVEATLKGIYADIHTGMGIGINAFYNQVCNKFLNIKKEQTTVFLKKGRRTIRLLCLTTSLSINR